MTIRLEWKPEDMWIGAFWRRGRERIDIWICVVPMLPIHIIRWRNTGLELRPRAECPPSSNHAPVAVDMLPEAVGR